MKNLPRKYIRPLFQLLGIAIFATIVWRIDFKMVLDHYRHIDPRLAIPAAIIAIIFILTKSYRWKMIVNMQNIDISLKDAVLVYTASLYLGIITPGRVGDFAKSYFLANSGTAAGRAIFSSILDRLFDIIFLVLIGFASMMFFPDLMESQILLSSLILGIIAIICIAVFWRRDLLKRFVAKFVRGSEISAFRANAGRVINDILDEFNHLKFNDVLKITLLTLAAWILHYSFFVFAASSLDIQTSVPILVMSISAAIFVGLIPISISGVGTRDLVLIMIFSRVGLTEEQAVTFSLTFIGVYIIIGLAGLVCWLSAPFKLNRVENT